MDISGSIAKRLGGEEGVTLVELSVYVVLSLVILIGATTFIVDGFHQQNTVTSRTAASRTAEAGLQQLTHDLSDAITSVSASTSSTATTLSFYLPTPGNDTSGEAVTWTCTDGTSSTVGTCARTLNGLTKTLITGVESLSLSPVSASGTNLSLPLSSATNVAYMGITLEVQILSQVNPNSPNLKGKNVSDVPASTSPITVQAGADLENFS